MDIDTRDAEYEALNTRFDIIREIQTYCADILASGRTWTEEDATHVASLLNRDFDPWDLFRYMDERTGAADVGYRTRDGREWFPILRQMRNTAGSGLLESLHRS